MWQEIKTQNFLNRNDGFPAYTVCYLSLIWIASDLSQFTFVSGFDLKKSKNCSFSAQYHFSERWVAYKLSDVPCTFNY